MHPLFRAQLQKHIRSAILSARIAAIHFNRWTNAI
jgi:hypothetical protein